MLRSWVNTFTQLLTVSDSRLALGGTAILWMESRVVAGTEETVNPTMRMRYVPPMDTFLAQAKTFAVVSLSLPTIHHSISDTNSFPFHSILADDYECYRDVAGSPKCRPYVTSTRTASGSGFVSTPRPTSTGSSGGVNSAVTAKNSFNLFGIAPFLGWIGESSRTG